MAYNKKIQKNINTKKAESQPFFAVILKKEKNKEIAAPFSRKFQIHFKQY
jgi:hypothetical protein